MAARSTAPVARRRVLPRASERGDQQAMLHSVPALLNRGAGRHGRDSDANGAGVGELFLQGKLPRRFQLSKRSHRPHH